MNGNQSNVWPRLVVTLTLAFLFGLLAYVTLRPLPATANTFPDCGKEPISPPAGTEVFTVTGTVVNTDGTTPVECVEVFAFSGAANGRAFTNGSGHYTLTLSVGTYDLAFHPPLTSGLASQLQRGIRKSQELNVTLLPGHLISGTVYSDIAKTNPVSNVNVFASNPNTFVGLGATPTLSDGTYMLSLETGGWELTFTPSHFLGLGPTRTAVISLTQIITQDAILPSGFTVYGQVTANSVGVANVDIFAQDPLSDGFGITATDADGIYTGTLPAGNFDILFFAPPFSGYGSTVVTNITGPPDVQQNVSLPAGHTISGKVTACGAGLANVFVHGAPEASIPTGRLSGWGRFTGIDGFYALALQQGVYTITVDPPGISPPPRIIPSVTVTQDLTLDFDFCTLFLPIIFKSPPLDLVDDFDDGEEPNALGGFSSINWPVPCPPTTISSDYDPMAYSGSYSYRLSYNVTPICYGVWQTDLRDWNYSGFSMTTFWIKGATGNEQARIYLQDSDNCQALPCRHFVNVGSYLPTGRVTTEWQQARIPLNVFASHGVNLMRLRFFQVVFEHDNLTGTVYVDEIRFE